jgi:hypothetical protein
MNQPETLAALQAENARLIALLESHGIEWRPLPSTASAAREAECRTFLTVSVTVFQIFKKGRPFIHAGWRRLFHSTYPTMSQEVLEQPKTRF